MEEPHFVVPPVEFKKYSKFATEYKQSVQLHNQRLTLLYKQRTETYLIAPSDRELQWALAESQKQVSDKDQAKNYAIAKRMLAEKAEIDELKRQEEEHKQKLEQLFVVEAALFQWAEEIGTKAQQSKGKVQNEVTWDLAKLVLNFLEKNLKNQDLNSRLTSAVELAFYLSRDYDLSADSQIKKVGKQTVEVLEQIETNNKFLRPRRDRTISFSYDFMDTQSRVSHSRTKSAAWVKKHLHSDKNGHFTRKQLVLLFALYMGINHIESLLSMEFENKLIHALGRSDLLGHKERAGRLSFSRKKNDFIAQQLQESLKDMLSTPTKNGGRIEYVSDANITDHSLELLISLASCVSKLETSYSYKKNGPHVDNTLDILEQTYDRMYQRKGADFKGIADLIGKGEEKRDLPGSVKKLLRDKDPVYLPARSRPQGRAA